MADEKSLWRKWASKIQGKAGEMGWLFAFVLVTCILILLAGYFTGILPKLWAGATGATGGPKATLAVE